MKRAHLREHLLACSCGARAELREDSVFCSSCGRITPVPHDIVQLLRCEEVWAEKWDSLHTMVSDFIAKHAPSATEPSAPRHEEDTVLA